MDAAARNTFHTAPSSAARNTFHTAPSSAARNTFHTAPSSAARNTFHTAPSSAAIQCKIQSVIFHFGIQDILQRACCGQHGKIFPFFYAPGIFGLEIIILYYILFKVLLPVLQPAQSLGTKLQSSML